MHSNWTHFKSLCRIIGGQDKFVLEHAYINGILPQLIELAYHRDLLPALATRVAGWPLLEDAVGEAEAYRLSQALHNNTHRNMLTVVQALKIARALNTAGITPTFLKGTAHLLTLNKNQLGFRKQVDIDLVVPTQDLRAASQTLLDSGYYFHREARKISSNPETHRDVNEALKTSVTHHHLPPMVNKNYHCSVELHRHFLPIRFQSKNPLDEFLSEAQPLESHGATFQIPSVEHRIIHMVLGKMLNDSYLSRRDFPLREGFDYIQVLESVEGNINWELVSLRCGRSHSVFAKLTRELMANKTRDENSNPIDIKSRLRLMEKRFNSQTTGKLLDTYARALRLSQQMVYSPEKLPKYLGRLSYRH
jgi:hypothetical protein